MGTAIEKRHKWREKIVALLLSYAGDGEPTGTPEEMIDEAAQRAFKISTALGLIPGPIGLFSILPEVMALTKLQIGLIHRIARHHNKQEKVNHQMILLILSNAMGVTAGGALIRKMGTKLVVKSVNTRIIKGIAGKIGTRIIDTAAQKAVGRWIPMITAPLFGYFSRSLTRKIGREAERVFSQEIEIEPADGHAS